MAERVRIVKRAAKKGGRPGVSPARRAAFEVLRRVLWLDRVVEHFSGRKAGKLDAAVRLALRMGLFQLRFLTRVPAHAAVNESVQLAHAKGFRSAASYVNAVLRRATREPDFDPTEAIEDPLERIAVETSHP